MAPSRSVTVVSGPDEEEIGDRGGCCGGGARLDIASLCRPVRVDEIAYVWISAFFTPVHDVCTDVS